MIDAEAPADLVPGQIVDNARLEQPPGAGAEPFACPAEGPLRIEAVGDELSVGRPRPLWAAHCGVANRSPNGHSALEATLKAPAAETGTGFLCGIYVQSSSRIES